jgi:predicted sugar kinase
VNVTHYHEIDQEQAKKEHMCSMDLLTLMAIALYYDDLEEAKQVLNDLNKSLDELSKLKERKQNYDQLMKIAQKLSKEGIVISVVQRRVGR